MGRLDQVADAVGAHVGRGVHPPLRIGLGGRFRPATGQEIHVAAHPGHIFRRIGAAHVERAEERRLREAAFEGVTLRREERSDQRGDRQERVVVVGREDAQRRLQPHGRVGHGIGVALHGKELHGLVVRPALPHGRRGQVCPVLDGKGVEHRAGRCFGPCGPALPDLDAVAVARCAERGRSQADGPLQQQGVVGIDRAPVRCEVEGRRRMEVGGPSQQGAVFGCSRKLQPQGASRAAAVGNGERRSVVVQGDRGTGIRVARDAVDQDADFHRSQDSGMRSRISSCVGPVQPRSPCVPPSGTTRT